MLTFFCSCFLFSYTRLCSCIQRKRLIGDFSYISYAHTYSHYLNRKKWCERSFDIVSSFYLLHLLLLLCFLSNTGPIFRMVTAEAREYRLSNDFRSKRFWIILNVKVKVKSSKIVSGIARRRKKLPESIDGTGWIRHILTIECIDVSEHIHNWW